MGYGREALATGAIAGMVVVAFLFSAAAASAPTRFVHGSRFVGVGYPDWLAGPLAGMGGGLTHNRFIVAVVVLWALYLVVVALADSLRLGWVVGGIVVLHAVFVLGPPAWLSDVFNYIGFARLGAVHGLDPYTHHISEIPGDSVFQYVTWRDITTPYGPLFTLASYPLALLGIGAAIWVLKLTVVAASLVCVWLVWLIARELDRPAVPAIAFIGLNPLLLYWGVGGSHNDVFMLALLLAGVLLALRGRAAHGAGAVVAAGAFKVTAGLALPFMWLASRQRRRAVVGGLWATAGILLLSAITFGTNLVSAITSFTTQENHTSIRSFPGQITEGLLGAREIPPVLPAVGYGIFALVVLALLHGVWRRGVAWLDAIGWGVLAFLLTLTWLMPWYVIWLLPFAAVSANRRLRFAALLFGTFVVIVRMPYPPFA